MSAVCFCLFVFVFEQAACYWMRKKSHVQHVTEEQTRSRSTTNQIAPFLNDMFLFVRVDEDVLLFLLMWMKPK